MISNIASASLAAILLLNPAFASPIFKRSETGPHTTTDFPDPTILHVGDTWYALGSQSAFDNKDIHVQIATSRNFDDWELQQGQDAMPDLPAWVNSSSPEIWAPDLIQVADGSYVLYFSATTNSAGDGKYHCVGTAVSTSAIGPFVPHPEPFVCPTDDGGAIDASAFMEADGTHYVLYKIDANANGNGGECGNTVDPILSTPIMIQGVEADGFTKTGTATQILANADEDGPLVEAPSMIHDGDGTYFLFYSSGCYTETSYTAKYATSDSPTGTFTRGTNNPVLKTGGIYGLSGPGGLDAAFDNVHVAFHALSSAGDGRRFMYTGSIHVDGETVSM